MEKIITKKMILVRSLIKYTVLQVLALLLFFGVLAFGGKIRIVSAAPIQPVDINESSFPDANFRA